jgi:ATP-dependent Lhr-like helicase
VLGSDLWRLAWAGEAVNDTFLALRRGIESSFEAIAIEAPAGVGGAPRARRRGAFRRWQGSRPFPGRWSAPPPAEEGELDDPLAREELRKDRARLLLDRYGILFRELLAHELPALQWRHVARALRLLELGGEIVAGHFFTGIRGLQFASKEAFRRLRDGLPKEAIWWLSAQDRPALRRRDRGAGSPPRRHSDASGLPARTRPRAAARRRG